MDAPVNRQLADYYAAIEAIPPSRRVLFLTDDKLYFMGNLRPLSTFAGYYFMEKGERSIPDLGAWVGPLRAIDYRRPRSIDSESFLANACSSAGPGDRMVVYKMREDGRVEKTMEQCGCEAEYTIGRLIAFKKSSSSTDACVWKPKRYHVQGFESEYEYILVYGDEFYPDVSAVGNVEEVFSRGHAHLLRRRL